MDTTSPCYSAEDMDIIHKGHKDTGKRVPAPSGSGVQLEVWRCKCGKDTLDVLPKHMRK